MSPEPPAPGAADRSAATAPTGSAPPVRTDRPHPLALSAGVALGGALGAAVRYLLGTWHVDAPDTFGWTTFTINVSGALILALVPALGPVRRSPLLAATVGAGLLGGYTTLSTYSEQTRALLGSGHVALGAAYALGTLAATLGAVVLADRLTPSADPGRDEFAAEGGDE